MTTMRIEEAREVLRAARPGMSRRQMLRTLTAAATVLTAAQSLVGCQAVSDAVSAITGTATGVSNVLPAIAQDVALVAQALQSILPTIETLTGLAGGAKNTITNLVATVSGAASSVASAAGTEVTNIVNTIGSAVGSIGGLLASVPSLPNIIGQVLSDVESLLPSIQQATGASPTARHFVRRAGFEITPDQARADLRLIVLRGGR